MRAGDVMELRCEGCGEKIVWTVKAPGRARKWCSERCRKAQYGGECVDCGARTRGGNGRGPRAPKRCQKCAHVASAVWSRDAIIEALHRWVELYGFVPSAADWNPTLIGNPARRAVAERRYRGQGWPSWNSVHRWFGGMQAAVRAAGYEPRLPGARGADRPETVRRAA